MVSIGDKVSFLNDKLDGVVRDIISDTIAKVEITDGFMVDALIRELVVTKKFIADRNGESAHEEGLKTVERTLYNVKENTVTFIASPSETHKVLTGGVSYFLINNTSFTVLYMLAVAEKNRVKTLSLGMLESGVQKLLCSQSRESMIDWDHFSLQLLFAGDKQLHRPVSKDLPVLLPDLNPTTDKNNGQMFSKFILLADFNLTETVSLEGLKDKFELPVTNKRVFESPLSTLKSKTKIKPDGSILLNSKEVDLHIEELTADFSHLDNSEMLNIQLTAIRKEMDAAILNNFKSIVFIHGVGNGKLKQEMLAELKNYSGITIRNASYEKYGSGATEVLF